MTAASSRRWLTRQLDIVHGDVKPENVLVFNNECGLPVPKVADFGFSCLGAKDTDVIKMPKTPPWEAPEWHDRGFTISAAKKADFYSFGLLCVWTLFNDQLVEPSSDVSESTEGKMVFFLSKPTLELKEIMEFGALKSQDAISNLAEKMVHRSCAANKGQSEALVEFFHGALCFNPSGRSLRLSNLSNTEHLEKYNVKLHL
jgi:serine/threonine protein kinase